MNTIIRNTTLMRRMSSLDTIYARVERAQSAFRASAESRGSPVACPKLCGTCCVHFVPDLLPVEADRLAHFLLTGKREMIDLFFERREEAEAIDAACPFWNPDKPGENCMIYPARPLICRLFGFSSVADKCGEPAFALCRQMPSLALSQKRSFTGKADMESLFGAVPPSMADFSREIVALDPCEAGLRAAITEALPPAFSRVSLVLKLAAAETGAEAIDAGEADSDPDDFPVAS